MEYQELFCREWTAEDCDRDTDELLAAASDEYESGSHAGSTIKTAQCSHGHAHSNSRTLRFAQPLPDEQIIGARHKLVFHRVPKKDKILCQ